MKTQQPEKTDLLGHWIRIFLKDYLITVRNLSVNTQLSYRDTFRMLVTFVSKSSGIKIDRLKVEDVTKEIVLNFLDKYIEQERKSSVTSRNQRLTAIKSFAKFLAWECPDHIEWCSNIRLIPIKKTVQRQVSYMDKEEIDALTEAPLLKGNQKQSQRDHIILMLMYNTGARVSEVINIRIQDIVLPKKKGVGTVTLHGKGRHERTCPLWEDFWSLLKPLISDRNPEERLFLNRYGQPMTRHCIYDLVKKYADQISKDFPNLKGKRPTPHTIRHTTATHLLDSGTDIDAVRNWLGHASITTTNIYAEISMDRKLEILKKCETPDSSVPKRNWSDDEKLMAFLDSL